MWAPPTVTSSQRIRHRPRGEGAGMVADNWLPDGKVTLGIRAGASTPSLVIGDVMGRIANYCFGETG